MNRWIGPIGVLLLSLLVAATAIPKERGGVRMPDAISVAGKNLTLNGMGIREATVLNIDVYVAGLYLEKRSTNAQHIVQSKQTKRLVLHFVRDVEHEDIAEAFREGFTKNSGQAAARALEPRIERLIEWMSDLREDETLVFTFRGGEGVVVSVKGSVKGTIPGADFEQATLRLWLGPHPPNSGLKQGLLGKD